MLALLPARSVEQSAAALDFLGVHEPPFHIMTIRRTEGRLMDRVKSLAAVREPFNDFTFWMTLVLKKYNARA